MERDLDALGNALARARLATQKLGERGTAINHYASVAMLINAFNDLDNGGAFSEVDEHTGYEDPVTVLSQTHVSAIDNTER